MGWSAYREIHRRALIATFAATVALSGAAPTLALAETTDQQTNQAAAQATAASDATAQATDTTAAEADATAEEVGATVTLADGTTTENFDWIVHAVDAINNDTTGKYDGATLTIQKSVVTHPAYTFNKKITFTSASKDYSFDGTLVFQGAAASGSKVENVTFARGEAREGNINSVTVDGASNVTVSGCIFNAPSALFQGKEWQYNGVYVRGKVSGLEILDNQFNLGRMNDTNGSGATAVDNNANSGINLVGGGDGNIDGVTIKSNVLTVTAPNSAASLDASVNLLIANGNNTTGGYGIKNLTVTGNQYDGEADASNTATRFAGISNVEGATFSGNTIKNAARGIGQSIWGNTTQSNKDVTSSDNTFENVTSEGEYANEETVARVTVGGVTTPYEKLTDAVAAANKQDGAKVELFQSVTDHSSVTFTKKVEVVAANKQVTFNGLMKFTSASDGSSVSGIAFESDNNGGNISVEGAKDVKINDNIFTTSGTNQVNSIWVRSGSQSIEIAGNTFNAGGEGSVGVNIQSLGVDGVSVASNTLNDNYGNACLVTAFGKGDQESPVTYGITNLSIVKNTVNGSYPNKVIEGKGTNAVNLRNVEGAEISGNTFDKCYIAVGYAVWNGYVNSASTGITLKGNTFKDCLASVYFNELVNAGAMDASDFTYGTGNDVNTIVKSSYTKDVPYVSGMAFAGWYSDADFQTVAKAGDTNVYGKLVPISDVVKFMGNSLKQVTTGDYADYAKTDMRFGYYLSAPNSTAKMKSWSWESGYDGKKVWSVDGKNYRAELTDDEKAQYGENGVVSNLLIEGIPASYYGESVFYSKLTVTYVTDDGTTVTATDSTKTRTVKDLAQTIVENGTPSEKAYAQGILNKIDSLSE